MGFYNYLVCLRCKENAFVVKVSFKESEGSAGTDDSFEFLSRHQLCTKYIRYLGEDDFSEVCKNGKWFENYLNDFNAWIDWFKINEIELPLALEQEFPPLMNE